MGVKWSSGLFSHHVLKLRFSGRLVLRGSKVLRQVLSLLKSLQFARPSFIAWPIGARDGAATSLDSGFSLQKIVRLGSDFVTLVQRTGEVDDCSFSNKNFHGLDKTDLLDSGFMELVHVGDRPACLAAFSNAVHEKQQVQVELRLRCHPNEDTANYFRWIELICAPLESAEKDLVLCLARDISHWKERESQLIAREQVARDQIETKTRLLVNMSHELRTPLNTIIGFSQMMKLPGVTAQNERQMVEYAGIIFDSGQDLLGVVDEVLDMSQFDAGEYELAPEIFSVSDLVSASVELVQLEATEKDVRFLITGHEDDLQMNADLAACKQALSELLAAQIKGAAGGRVHLKVKIGEGTVRFVVTASVLDDVDQTIDFKAGLQLMNFVDVLSGTLDVTSSQSARNEVVLELAQNLCSDKKICNIVSLAPKGNELAEPMKKMA